MDSATLQNSFPSIGELATLLHSDSDLRTRENGLDKVKANEKKVISSVKGTCLLCGVEGFVKLEQVKIKMIKQLIKKPSHWLPTEKGLCSSCSGFLDRILLFQTDLEQTSEQIRDIRTGIGSIFGTRLSEEISEAQEDVKPTTVESEELIMEDKDSDVNENQLDSSKEEGFDPGFEYKKKQTKAMSKQPRHTKQHKGVHRNRKHICYFCSYAAYSSTTLLLHTLSHTLEKPWKCDICSKRLRSAGSLTYHKVVHSRSVTHHRCPVLKAHASGTRVFSGWCYFCKEEGMGSRNFATHMREHTLEKPYKCSQQVCKKVRYTTFAKLSNHLWKVHGIPKSEEAKPKHSCPSCKKLYRRKVDLTAHIAIVHEKTALTIKCGKCNYTTAYKSAMQWHANTIHNNERTKYKCRDCPLTFWSKAGWGSHTSRKHGY